MSAVVSFWINEHRLVGVQQLVKRYDMRFRNNPAAFLGQGMIHVVVEHNGDRVAEWRGFIAELDVLRSQDQAADPPKEARRPGFLERMLRGLFG